MKVGTDAVLLGAWADVTGAKRILDIGTGCGVIALMLAQRTSDHTHIDAIEIEKEDTLQAAANISASPWPNKISVFEIPLQEFTARKKSDLIVSNPPFFTDGLLPPSYKRKQSRHTKHLRHEELIVHTIRLLHPGGKVAVILPFREGNNFKSLAAKNGLYATRQLAIYSKKEKKQERWLFEFGFATGRSENKKIILYKSSALKSVAYDRLTRDFYL